ncbi:MAG TPA: hypothetical protein VJU81_02090 [Methylomirabilota bacterium]|nr:hypothetical protein [Methylomirabilota bacterium]
MATIKEVQASMHEPEHRIRFRPQDPAWEFVTVSGHVSINELQVWGTDDDVWDEYEVHMWIGPWWKGVSNVVPSVSIDHYDNPNADEDDWQGFYIKNLVWATDGQGAPSGSNEVRVRLEFIVGIRGENGYIRGLGYRATMAGRRLGEGGVNEPGPVFQGP